MSESFAEQAVPKLSFTQSDHEKSLLKELNKQRKAGKFCDVVLKVDDCEVVGHRAVLSSTLPQLSNSLYSRTDCQVFEIEGVNPEAVEILVDYSYTSSLQVPPDIIFPVLVAAQKFGMVDVIEVLESFIIEKVLPHNWLNVWKFAERQNYSKLCNAVEEFICSNIDSLFQKQDFLRLSRLQIELTGRHGDIKDDVDPKNICEKAVRWVQSQLQVSNQIFFWILSIFYCALVLFCAQI